MKCLKLNILFLSAVVLALSGCAVKEEAKAQAVQVIPVKVQKVERKDFPNVLEYVGNIKAQDEVQVYPKVTGKVIEKIKQDGVAVAKGEILIYIDRDEVGFKFEKAPVESPISGTVGRVYVDIGSNVNPQTPVALMVNMDKVKIDLDIPEKYLPKVALDQQAQILVDAYPQENFTGKVTKASPVLDLATRSAPIEITIDNLDHRLKSGMFARVNLIIEELKDVPVILKEAVMGKDPDTYVYVIENQKSVLKKVTLGLRQAEFLEVKDGLKEGDSVVIMGQQRLYDNAPVSIENNNHQEGK